MAKPSPLGFRAGIEFASDAIVLADAKGKVTYANPAARRLFAEKRLVGRALSTLFETSGRTPEAHVDAALRGGEQHVAAIVRTHDDERRAIWLRVVPVGEPGEDGLCEGVVAVLEREELRRQLWQSQKLEAIGQLVSGVAHELNNPLAAILAYAQLLLSSKTLTSDDRGAVDTMLHETKRAARIVSNLLTFARQHQPERSVTDINQVVTDTLSLRRYGLNQLNVTVDTRLAEHIPLTWADSFQVQQVLLNLITNAEHAMRGWMGERRLSVTTRYEAQTLYVEVSDTGPGIKPAVLDQIFNPFFTTKDVGEGTGLGLSIADGIVREHGGRIRVESSPGAGATFIVELPFVDPASAFTASPILTRGTSLSY